MVASTPPRGIFVPVPTFFAPTTASSTHDIATPPLAIATQSEHAVYLAKSGIKGLVLLGSTGEAVHITAAERKAMISGVRAALDSAGFPNYPLMAGTAANGIEETAEMLRESDAAGAQWGLVLAPGYFASAVTQEGVVRWFKAVADRSPIPVLVYHYPGVSNNIALPPSTLEKLAEHPNIVGCKLSHGNLDDLALIALSPRAKDFVVYTGLGQMLLPAVTIGAAGAIDGLAAFFPKTVVRIFNTFEDGTGAEGAKLAELRRLQYLVAAGEKMVAKWGVVGVKEGVRRLRGIGAVDGEAVVARAPLGGGFGLDEAEWAKWARAMAALEEVEQKL
ncbi:uncharacterized protein K452DRAFT_231233 [Aplosporella prunicola CBS 121167]|uniref:Dihydrodipicolinate synthase n=1 Tax=Aplosporella prunicola CBS 121167 TaxID=1176127 RepID=A0A6A6BAY4_9PEZI|nr:uncharacterized protein K452DRAFT_231233 [Aplosporella prunicola CBS 121167]KAF2140077.1 hypothetical protein K452DRAFT_231233 [Aplosporella prunicola CBS 121167]